MAYHGRFADFGAIMLAGSIPHGRLVAAVSALLAIPPGHVLGGDGTHGDDYAPAHFERGHARIRRFSRGEFRTWIEPFVPDHGEAGKGSRDLAPRLHRLSRACRTIVCVDSEHGDPHDPFLADAFLLGLRVNGVGIDETGGCECTECAIGGDPAITCRGGDEHACPTLTGPRWFRPLVRTMARIASR